MTKYTIGLIEYILDMNRYAIVITVENNLSQVNYHQNPVIHC
jgi:hypothetical protein